MKKILKDNHHKDHCGVMGSKTPLVDSHGKKLRIGDVVAWEHNGKLGLSYVCDTSAHYGYKPLERVLVMGLGDSHCSKNGHTTQDHKNWKLTLIKKYEDEKIVVNAEMAKVLNRVEDIRINDVFLYWCRALTNLPMGRKFEQWNLSNQELMDIYENGWETEPTNLIEDINSIREDGKSSFFNSKSFNKGYNTALDDVIASIKRNQL